MPGLRVPAAHRHLRTVGVRINTLGIVGMAVCLLGMALFFIVNMYAGLAVLAVGLVGVIAGLRLAD